VSTPWDDFYVPIPFRFVVPISDSVPIRCSDFRFRSDSLFRFASESEEQYMAVSDRIKEAIGDEPVAAFARRCGFGESLLRKYLSGSEPSATNLSRIADAAGVSLEWLATGRGKKERKPASEKDFSAVPYARRLEKIGLLLADMTEQEAEAFLDDVFARARSAAEASELRRALADLRAEVERLKKSA
jgi:transcriptional regulator with XRE-family HTH domain